MANKRDITTNTFEALGVLLEEHYGRFNGDISTVENYATLWDTLLDALKGDTIDRDQFDEVYIRLALTREAQAMHDRNQSRK